MTKIPVEVPDVCVTALCPFCNEPQPLICGPSKRGTWWLRCDTQSCDAQGPSRPSKAEAIAAWNAQIGFMAKALRSVPKEMWDDLATKKNERARLSVAIAERLRGMTIGEWP